MKRETPTPRVRRLEEDGGNIREGKMEKETLLLSAYDPVADAANIQRAGDILRRGGIVAIPTETVYGLAGNALDPAATGRIYAAKGRPSDNPLIVHIARWEDLYPLVQEVPEEAVKLAGRCWPGPLTIILEKSAIVPETTSGGLSTVAVRMPDHPIARAVIQAAGVPLAAPSANRSGSPSPTSWRHCREDLWGRADAILASSDCRVGVESTVLSLCREEDGKRRPRLLRPGAVTLEQLREMLGEVVVDRGVLERISDGQTVRSPGMKYRHYAPAAQVVLVRGSREGYRRYLEGHRRPGEYAVCFAEELGGVPPPALSFGGEGDHAAQAQRLFDLLRELDRLGAEKVYVHAPATDGVGLAVYNRLIRAAGFQVVELP